MVECFPKFYSIAMAVQNAILRKRITKMRTRRRNGSKNHFQPARLPNVLRKASGPACLAARK